MSCDPEKTDCSEILDHLYEYLDNEVADGDCVKFRMHLDECHPCLEKYGLEQAVKKLVKRCCGSDQVPSGLRGKVMGRIEAIRAGEAAEVPPRQAETCCAPETVPQPADGTADADATEPHAGNGG